MSAKQTKAMNNERTMEDVGTFEGITLQVIQSYGMADTSQYGIFCQHSEAKQKERDAFRMSSGTHHTHHILPAVFSAPVPDLLVLGNTVAHDGNGEKPYPLHGGFDMLEQYFHVLRSRGFKGPVLFRDASVEIHAPFEWPMPGVQWQAWLGNAAAHARIADEYGWHTIRTTEMSLTRPDRFYDRQHVRPAPWYHRTPEYFPATTSAAFLRRLLHVMHALPEVA